jgi:hypothetical protein
MSPASFAEVSLSAVSVVNGFDGFDGFDGSDGFLFVSGSCATIGRGKRRNIIINIKKSLEFFISHHA